MNELRMNKAEELFKQGFNCAQSVIGAWSDHIGLDMDTAVKISCGFGAGIGRMREVCGAFSGAVMVLGMVHGNADGKNAKAKGEHYKLIQDFAEKYKEAIGRDTIICRELLGLAGPSEPTPEKRTETYYKKRPCVEMVKIAAGLLEDFV